MELATGRENLREFPQRRGGVESANPGIQRRTGWLRSGDGSEPLAAQEESPAGTLGRRPQMSAPTQTGCAISLTTRSDTISPRHQEALASEVFRSC